MNSEGTQPKRIFIVDDESTSVQPLIYVLQQQGYETLHVEDEQQAVEALSSFSPHLILLDVTLEQGSGFDLYATIRKLEGLGDIPILFLSGLESVDTILKGLQLGAYDYIVKPYRPLELAARIGLQLRLHEQQILLAQKNQELTKANDEVKKAQAAVVHAERLAAIGSLSAGLVHELSTPIGFVLSNTKTLKQYIRDLRSVWEAYRPLALSCMEQQAHAALALQAEGAVALSERLQIAMVMDELDGLTHDCIEGVEILAGVARDLREFSRQDDGEWGKEDLHLLVEKALKLSNHARSDSVKLDRDFGTLPLVDCMGVRITQLFLIVLVNSYQAVEANGQVLVRTHSAGDNVCITISDTGCGVSKSDLPRIFEPFFTTKHAEQGTGLGLSIAQQIVAVHQGRIMVQSEPGKGTSIYITLPVRRSCSKTHAHLPGVKKGEYD